MKIQHFAIARHHCLHPIEGGSGGWLHLYNEVDLRDSIITHLTEEGR
jgi:hypothetical protein